MLLIECIESENCSIIFCLLARQSIGWMPMLHLMRQSRSFSVALSLSSILRTSLYDEHEAIVNRWYDARKGEDGATHHGKIIREFFISICILFYNIFMGAVDIDVFDISSVHTSIKLTRQA